MPAWILIIGNNKKAELADILDEYLGNVHEKEEAEVFVTGSFPWK